VSFLLHAEINDMNNPLIKNHVYTPLRLTFGLVPIVAGLDKYTNLLTDWSQYVSPMVRNVLPFDAATLMYLIGPVEIIVGVLILSRHTRIGAWLAAGWLTLIAVELLTLGRLDVAVRDLVMAVAAYGLAHLAPAFGEARAAELSPTS